MNVIARRCSIVLGAISGYLAFVGLFGLVMTTTGLGTGPLVMRIGAYGVTSESLFGWSVCFLITLALTVVTWALLFVLPAKLAAL